MLSSQVNRAGILADKAVQLGQIEPLRSIESVELDVWIAVDQISKEEDLARLDLISEALGYQPHTGNGNTR